MGSGRVRHFCSVAGVCEVSHPDGFSPSGAPPHGPPAPTACMPPTLRAVPGGVKVRRVVVRVERETRPATPARRRRTWPRPPCLPCETASSRGRAKTSAFVAAVALGRAARPRCFLERRSRRGVVRREVLAAAALLQGRPWPLPHVRPSPTQDVRREQTLRAPRATATDVNLVPDSRVHSVEASGWGNIGKVVAACLARHQVGLAGEPGRDADVLNVARGR